MAAVRMAAGRMVASHRAVLHMEAAVEAGSRTGAAGAAEVAQAGSRKAAEEPGEEAVRPSPRAERWLAARQVGWEGSLS